MRRGRGTVVIALTALLGLIGPPATAAAEEAPPSIVIHPPPKAEWQLSLLPLSEPAQWLELNDDKPQLNKVRILSQSGEWYRLATCGGASCIEPLGNTRPEEQSLRDAVPGTLAAVGSENLRMVYLSEPTERLATPWFGRQLAAGALVAIDRLKARHRTDVGLDRAVVMVRPWLADLDGDKLPEVVTVEAAGDGQRIVVYAFRGAGLERMAESQPAGVTGDILDIVAIADFDGDSKPDIAATVGKDGGERLQIWRPGDRALTLLMTLKGFASRQPQTTRTGIGIAADFDGDSVTDLLLPAADFRSIRIVSLAGGAAAEPMRLKLAAAITTNLLAIKKKDAAVPTVVFGLADGNLAILKQVVVGEE